MLHFIKIILRSLGGCVVIKIMLALCYLARLVYFVALPDVVEDLEHSRFLFKVAIVMKVIQSKHDRISCLMLFISHLCE